MKRTRGRPRSFDPDAALKAATERFRVGGYSGTSLDDLAAATGLARPSLYAAFGDKRALYLQAVARAHARAEAGFAALTEAELTLPQALERLFENVIDGYLTGENGAGGCIAVSTAAAEAASDPEVQAALARFLRMEDDCVERLLLKHAVPGAAEKARVVAAVIHSLSTRSRAGEPRATLDAVAAACAAMVVG